MSGDIAPIEREDAQRELLELLTAIQTALGGVRVLEVDHRISRGALISMRSREPREVMLDTLKGRIFSAFWPHVTITEYARPGAEFGSDFGGIHGGASIAIIDELEATRLLSLGPLIARLIDRLTGETRG
ncbi:MAG: hypothetical protein R3E87_15060 [Burkholderiaceae bacterium]